MLCKPKPAAKAPTTLPSIPKELIDQFVRDATITGPAAAQFCSLLVYGIPNTEETFVWLALYQLKHNSPPKGGNQRPECRRTNIKHERTLEMD